MDDATKKQEEGRTARIALVTDSTCDLRQTERLEYVTETVPLHVTVGGVSYVDGVDLDSRQFYERFREAGQSAQSSQPSVGDFSQVYSALLETYDAVASVHISARLSGTVQAATIAAQAVDPARVRVIDSRKVSVGVGLVVQAAGEAIKTGADLVAVAAAAEAAATATRVYGTLRSLDVAVKGGRVSARAARFAGLIELKPLIVFDEEGSAHVNGARLGYPQALRAMAGRVSRFAAGGPARVAIVHADDYESAWRVRESLRHALRDSNADIPILEAGAVITAHVGLGTVAVGVQRLAPQSAAGRMEAVS